MVATIRHAFAAMLTFLMTTAARFVAYVNIAGENASAKESCCNRNATIKATQQRRVLPMTAGLQDKEGGESQIDRPIASITPMHSPATCCKTLKTVAESDWDLKPKTVGNLDNLLYQRNRMEIVNRSAETTLAF